MDVPSVPGKELGSLPKIRLSGPGLPLWACVRRLVAFGFAPLSPPELLLTTAGRSSLQLVYPPSLDSPRKPFGFACDISWYGQPSPDDEAGSEAVVQALCGLMQVHGLEAGRPRRLGLEVCSVAAGVLAANAVLAALIGRARGGTVSSAATSVLQAGLLATSQYIARAGCSEAWGDWVPVPRGSAPGPPFGTVDKRWFEVEILDPSRWKDFWSALGVDRAVLSAGWTLFTARYSTGVGSLPPGFHEATARYTLGQVAEVADSVGVSLAAVRSYREVLVEPGPGPVEHPLWEGSADEVAYSADTSARPPVHLPLEGVVVVEATSRLQGPLAGLLLRLLGARVIRVEPPGGDMERIVAPSAGRAGAFFLCVNRGKESVELDLNSEAGRIQLCELVASADVFLHNWRPGKAADWGLRWEDLVSWNPQLVYCRASGWGAATPSCPAVATEFLVQAYAALGEGLHPEDEPGLPSRVLLVDFMGGLLACEGILWGLLRRHETGRGVSVESSLLAGAMALQAHVLTMLASGEEAGRKRGRPIWGPLDRPIRALDGWLTVTACERNTVRRLAELCGASPDGGPAHDARMIIERFPEYPAEEWERRLQATGIPCARVRTDLGRLAADPVLASLLEPLGTVSAVPRSPWTFG